MRALGAGLVSLAICGCLLGGVSPSVASVPHPASSPPVVTAIAVGSNPAGIAVDSAADLVYVANQGSDSVSVVDGASNKVVATIKLPAGAGPTDLAVDPATKLLYVVEQPLHTVQVIDAKTDALGTAINVSNLSGATTSSIAVDATADIIYVVTFGAVAEIDGAANAVTFASAFVGGSAGTVTVAPDTGAPFTGDEFDGAFDFVKRVALNTGIGVGSVATDDAGHVFVSNCQPGFANVAVWEFNASTDAFITRVISSSALCPGGIAVDGSTVFALNRSHRDIAVLNFATDGLTGTFSQVSEPVGIAVDPATHVFYVTDERGQLFAVPRQAPVFTTPTGAIVPAGSSNTFMVQTTANPAPVYSETGKLPAGVQLLDSGELDVNPAAGTAGRYPITISATNGVGKPATQSFMLTVTQPAGIEAPAKATFLAGRHGTVRIKLTGVPAPELTETGRLPAGLRLSGDTITGTPAIGSGGVYHLTLITQNGAGKAAHQALTLTVDQLPRFTSKDTLTCRAGHACRFTIRTSAFPAAAITESGKLPHGLKFTSGKNGTATISGTAARNARGKTFLLTFKAVNSRGSRTQHFSLKVS